MATPRNRQYQTKGKGRIDLGAILLGALGGAGTGEVEEIPQIKPESVVTDQPYDWAGKGAPTDIKPSLTERDISDIGSTNRFRLKNPMMDYSGKGQAAVNEANINRVLAEEQAQRELKYKEAGIPIAVKAYEALTPAEAARTKALGGVNTANEVARRQAIDPLDAAKAEHEATIAILAALGIQPTPENIQSHKDLISNIRLSQAAQGGYRKIAEDTLGEQEAKKGLRISTRNEPLEIDTANKQAQFGNIKAKQDLEAQPLLFQQYKETIPGMAEEEITKRAKEALLPPMRPGESVFSVKTKKPVFSVPTDLERAQQADQAKKQGIQPKLNPSNVFPQSTPAPQIGTPDPDNPGNVIITLPDGRKISVPRQ